MKSRIRERVNSNPTDSTEEVFVNAAKELSSTAAAIAAISKSSTKRTIWKWKRKMNVSEPHKSEDVDDISSLLKYTETGLQFLLGKSADNKILIFSTIGNLEILSECVTWFMDTTFPSVPKLYGHILTIYGFHKESVVPLVFCVMTEGEDDYDFVFETIESQTEFRLNPEMIICDFQAPVINSALKCFVGVRIQCSLFHLEESIISNLSPGFAEKYRNDADFQSVLRMFSALAFAPVHQVYLMFFELKCIILDKYIELLPFVKYFEETFIGFANGESGIYPLSVWNMYDRILENLPLTKYIIEGWNESINFRCKYAHPQLWGFIALLRAEQTEVEGEILVTDSSTIPQRRKQNIKLDKLLIDMVREYSYGDNIESYLIGISLNLCSRAN